MGDETMGTARLVKTLNARASAYRVVPSMIGRDGELYDWVVASVSLPHVRQPEVAFFPANVSLDGSESDRDIACVRPCSNHTDAFRDLDYEVIVGTGTRGGEAEMITIEQARQTVVRIAHIAGDPEKAHGEEDALHRMVLEAVAAGSPDGRELARIALKTRDIRFSRWCA